MGAAVLGAAMGAAVGAAEAVSTGAGHKGLQLKLVRRVDRVAGQVLGGLPRVVLGGPC